MATSRPGPASLDTRATGTYQHLGDRWARRDMLVDRHDEHKQRIKTVTHVVNGEWYVEWPDLTQTPEAPTVANIIEMGVSHWASVGGAVLPSLRAPVNLTQGRTQAKRGARKRERRVRQLWKDSHMTDLASLFWGDYAGTGAAIMGVWANFWETDLSKRNPYIMRFDPRTTYTLTDDLGVVKELLVARLMSKQELASRYPGFNENFKNSEETDIEEWFWYDADTFYHAIVDVSGEGRGKNRNIVLLNVPNKLGFVPAVEVVRPTFDGQRRGVFDQTVHILKTMHRLMTMTIYSVEENSFPSVLEYDVANPEDFRPGSILHGRSSEARIDRIGPSQHFDVKDLIARMTEEARAQAAFPQQLTGEPGASIASARAINASMGQLDARLAVAHKQFEAGFGTVSGMLLAMDEMYCNGEKQIVGDHRDANDKAETYFPERDVAGAWDIEATYGIGAGSDPANVETRLSMHMANGAVSMETYREQLPFLEDPAREPVLIMREQMQQALMAGVLQMAAQGDPTAAAHALELMEKDDVDYDEIMRKLVAFLAQPPPQQGAPPGGPGGEDPALAALQGAESLARGGIPGSAEQAPPAGLPPLAQLMGQDSKLVA
jgi:hypothetical protein